MNDLKTVAERLRWARLERGYSQGDLAKIACVTRDVIAQTEAGRTTMPRQIKEIADALEVSAEWLAFGVEGIGNISKKSGQHAIAYDNLTPEQQAIIDAMMEQFNRG